MARELVLAGDIGGTKTNLAVFSLRGEKLHAESQSSFPSKQYSGLTPILKEFCGNRRRRSGVLRHRRSGGRRPREDHQSSLDRRYRGIAPDAEARRG